MIYELRTYDIHPGKMKAIHDRFTNHTLHIFAKRGMKVVDFWEDTDPSNNRIYYVMEFKDKETRDQCFEQFGKDPEWLKVKAESEKDGPIVAKVESIFMQRVPYWGS